MPLSKILSASIASGAVSASNILEILSSPCNGTAITVPSGYIYNA